MDEQHLSDISKVASIKKVFPLKDVNFDVSFSFEDVFIKLDKTLSTKDKNLRQLTTGFCNPVLLSNGKWKFHLFLYNVEFPGVPLFSTYIYSDEEWFNPQTCLDCPGGCKLSRTRIRLMYDLNPDFWDDELGYFSNFKLVVNSYEHLDPSTGLPHKMKGSYNKGPIYPGCSNFSTYKIYMSQEDDFGFSSKKEECVKGTGYRLYYLTSDGDYVHITKPIEEHEEERIRVANERNRRLAKSPRKIKRVQGK